MICQFEKLLMYLDKQLNLDEQLEVLGHIEACDTCRDAIFHISRDRDADLFIYRPYNPRKVLVG